MLEGGTAPARILRIAITAGVAVAIGAALGIPIVAAQDDEDPPSSSTDLIELLRCPTPAPILVINNSGYYVPGGALATAVVTSPEEALDEFLLTANATVTSADFAVYATVPEGSIYAYTDGDNLLAAAMIEPVEDTYVVEDFINCDGVLADQGDEP